MRLICTRILFLLLCLGLYFQGHAQERYLDEVFTDVTVSKDVIYSVNYSIILAFLQQGDTMLLPEQVDIYEPMGDTLSNRPLLLYAVTGTFLPPLANQGFTGGRDDSTFVAFAKRMAKRGYVVGVVQYRRGWNPLGNPLIQRKTILQAAYRGIQDVRACVRFFRKTVEEDGNPYKIDIDRIAVGGSGTGAYMSYGASYLDRYDQTLKQKFIDFTDPDNPVPFLDTLEIGDPFGVDTAEFNMPNYPAYSSDFRVGFGFAGALGDSSWVEEGDIPFIAMHCERDPGAPYDVGDIIALDPTVQPAAPFAVIPDGAGGLGVLRRATRLGNQAIFQGVTWGDPISDISTAEHPDAVGLYSFDTPFTPGDAMCEGVGVSGDTLAEWGSPWTWWDPATAIAQWDATFGAGGERQVCRNERTGPNDPVVANLYLDTICAFISPRLALALDLGTSVGVNDFIQDERVEVFPNPAREVLRLRYKDGLQRLEAVRILDVAGRTVRDIKNINATEFEVQRQGLLPGLYIIQVSLPNGIVNKKILLE